MRNFPTHFWKRFQDHKERTAFIALVDKSTVTETYWEWTRRVQRLALGLMDAGITAGTRVGMVAPNSQQWLDTAFAAWLIGACIVPLTPDRDRRETLRCLARSGCDWIVVRNENARLDLRGQSASFPDHLQWLVLEGESPKTPASNDPINYFQTLEATGRDLGRRGHLNKLAERTYALDPAAPALILFESEPGPDPSGAFFSSGKLAVMLEYLGRDLPLGDDAVLAVLLSYGWLSAPLFTAAALLNGHCIAIAPTLSELNDNLQTLRPTHLVCGPAFLENQSDALKKRIESAPEFIKKITSIGSDATDASSNPLESLSRAVGTLGERAAQKLLYDPLIKELGGRLKSIYLWNGRVPKDVYELLDHLNIEILGHFGLPECGISHIEHPGARRQNSVGRPVQGYICKIDGSKADRPGPILIRSDTLFDGYWSETGPRQIDENGYLQTHITGHIQSGYLFIDVE